MNTPSPKDQPVTANGRHVVGIDVGKKHHAAAGVTALGADFGRVLWFPQLRAGIDRLENLLLKPLGQPSQILIGMEATGHYWMPLYFELRRRGYEMVVINPIQTQRHFRTRIRKAKTDKLDARSIARLVLRGEARASRIPDEKSLELRILSRQRCRLLGLKSQLEVYLLSLEDRLFPEFAGVVCKSLSVSERHLIREFGLVPQHLVEHETTLPGILWKVSRGRWTAPKVQQLLERAKDSIGLTQAQGVLVRGLRTSLDIIESIETQIAELDGELERRIAPLSLTLDSLGLKAPLIATIYAESHPISDFKHPWQYAAYAGLDPAVCESGQYTSTRAHISKRGSPFLRGALYQAAFAIYRHHKDLSRLYHKHRKAGRHHTNAMVIVAHKLARIVWRLLTDNRPYRVKHSPRKGA